MDWTVIVGVGLLVLVSVFVLLRWIEDQIHPWDQS